MQPTHRYHLFLLLLLTLCHAVAGEDQLKKPFIIFFGILGLVLAILLYSIFTFCRKLKTYKPEKEEEKQEEEKSLEAMEQGERKCWEVNENGGVVVGDEEAVGMQEEEKITFVKGWSGFDLNDLLRASAEGLGKGSFGSCYKVMLHADIMVVVKRLRDLGPVTKEEFVKYIRALSAREHPNLLPLLGYYISSAEKLLISNYACNGNLFNRIHGGRGSNGSRTPFPWRSRLMVAHGVAQALEYLHLNMIGSCVVPHGNLKSSNILLDENDKPLVCDFGLCPLVPPSLATKRMVCYNSPDYQNNRCVSRKTDVWSYGCVLLELITGRVSANSAPGGVHGVELCHWVNRAVREEWTAEVFDEKIVVQQGESSELIMLLKLALRCCEWPPEKRPDMGAVAKEVESIASGAVAEDD